MSRSNSDTTVPSSPITTISDPTFIEAANRGPITTPFSPPPSCTATLTTEQSPGENLYAAHYGTTFFDASCFPPGTLDVADLLAKPSWAFYYYSPAICPRGWSATTTFTSAMPGLDVEDNIVFMRVGPGTTAALCCPEGYALLRHGHLCASTVTRNQRVLYISPTNTGDGWDRGVVSTSTIASGTVVFGDGVPIMWQHSDEAILAAAATSLSTSSSDVLSTSTSPPPPSPHSGNSLSTGAKAGIGIGVAVIVLIAATAALVIFIRRKRREVPPETRWLPEVTDIGPVEKDSQQEPQELPALTPPVEVHTSPTELGSSIYSRTYSRH